jgi:hypothetical protein
MDLSFGKVEMKKLPCKKAVKKQRTDGTNATHEPKRVNQARLDGSAHNPVTRIPPDVVASMDRACEIGKWLIAIFHVDHDKLILDRTAMNFPVADLELASRLFVENVQRLK